MRGQLQAVSVDSSRRSASSAPGGQRRQLQAVSIDVVSSRRSASTAPGGQRRRGQHRRGQRRRGGRHNRNIRKLSRFCLLSSRNKLYCLIVITGPISGCGVFEYRANVARIGLESTRNVHGLRIDQQRERRKSVIVAIGTPSAA